MEQGENGTRWEQYKVKMVQGENGKSSDHAKCLASSERNASCQKHGSSQT